MEENSTEKKVKSKRCNTPQQEVVDFFEKTENQDKIISPKEYYALNKRTKQWFNKCIGRMFFAQAAIEVNQRSKMEVKMYYEDMLNQSLSKFDAETIFEIANSISDEKKKNRFLVSKQMVVESLSKLTSPTSKKEIGTISETGKIRTIDYVSEYEAMVKRARDEYVMAPLGETPNISEIVGRVGDGKLVIDEIRKIAVDENWRADRANYLYQSLDLVPEEVKLVTMLRTVEVHKLLYTHIKILHRLHMDYYKSGRVRSLDGTADLRFNPDPGQISGLAETMRRLVDGSNSVNIMINNQGKVVGGIGLNEGGLSLGSGNDDGRASLLTKKYLSQLNKMSADDLETEIDNLTKLRHLMSGKAEDIIDAVVESPEESRELQPEKKG